MKSKILFKLIFAILFVVMVSIEAKADVELAHIFSDNMVLQRNKSITVWGTGDVGEKVNLSFNNQTVSTIVDEKGEWELVLKAMKAGGPYEMLIEGKNKINIKNILIGDVWICSGQSNMAWKVKNAENAETEISNANYKNIRLLKIPNQMSNVPVESLPKVAWNITTPDNIPDFSAVAYFFGREIHKELNVPIGLIQSAWGGTCVETWTSKEFITKLPNYENMGERIDEFDVAVKEQEKKDELIKLIGKFPTEEFGYKENWMHPEFNRSNWRTMDLPNYWEDLGYENFDGIVWFNYEFELDKKAITNENAYLSLGKIDDNDVTWVNGKKVGQSNNKSQNRKYKVDSQILTQGTNNITIRVQDFWGKGGFDASKSDFYLEIGDQTIPLHGQWKFKVDYVRNNFLPSPNEVPSLLYNAMIHPLLRFPIKGTIWYQGENNARRAKEYALSFPNMINNWREDWGQGDFPFLFVQLANFRKPKPTPSNDNWAELRESQTKTLKLKNTGMAVAIDLGEANNIHPKNKQDVGQRLALAALKVAYNKKVVHSGPQFKSMKVKNNKAYIKFKYLGSGLTTKNNTTDVNEFEISGEDKKFYKAQAKIENNKVVVWSDKVANPVAVRFAWSINPSQFNLYNEDGLPAVPFRTDDWKGITDGKSFDD